MLPPPLATLQVKVGWVARALPNWSFAVALNCWVTLIPMLAEAGDTVIEVSVWLTETLTLLVPRGVEP